MKNKNFILGIFVLIVMLLSVTTTQALFPNSHAYVIHHACEKGYDSDLARMCCRNENACIAGTLLDDISIIYYLERGMKKYTVTHSSLFCHEVIGKARTQTEQAVAAGMCLHHPVDIEAHNILVPYAIRHTAMPNYLIHPFAEQKVDNYVLKIDPNAPEYIRLAMDDAMEYVPFIQRVLQPNQEYGNVDVKQLTIGFIEQLRTSKSGYDASFNTVKAIPKIIWFTVILLMVSCFIGVFFLVRKTERKRINIITASILLLFGLVFLLAIIGTFTGSLWGMFTTVAKPVSYLVPTPSPGVIIDDAQELTLNMMKYGVGYVDSLPPNLKDATGIGITAKPGPIVQAENDTRIIRIIIVIILLLLIGWMVYLNIRK